MASIRKRGSSYQITVSMGYDVTGKKITATDTYTPDPKLRLDEAKERAAAELYAAEFEASIKRGRNIKGERTTLKTLADMYLREMKTELARTTYKDYSDRIKNRIIPAMGHIQINTIRKKDVSDYENMLRETYRNPRTGKPLSEETIRKDSAIISSLLSYAVFAGLLPMNILIYAGKTQKQRRKRSKDKRPNYFTVEQLIRFIDALEHPIPVKHQAHKTTVHGHQYDVAEYVQDFRVSNKWKLYFYIAMFSGDRRGENISLTWNDLNMQTREITIGTSTDYVDGTMELKETKTGNDRENILPEYVITVAKHWKREQMLEYMSMGENWKGYRGPEYDKNFIFTQKNGSQMHICSPYNKYKQIIRLYNQYAAKNDTDRIPENVKLHGLRHSTAAILISNNIDARTVADILGHANPSTTLNIYSYFFKRKGKEAAEVMEQTLFLNTK